MLEKAHQHHESCSVYSFVYEKPTKDIALFSRCNEGFSGSKGYCIVIYAVLGINCFLSSYFIYFLPFKVSVCT